jgi:hypothetical protein
MMDFPSSPTEGQVYSPAGGPSYIYTGGVWRMQGSGQVVTAQTRNRVVNPAMQITQEFARSTNLTALAYFADQWLVTFAGDGTLGFANVPNTLLGADAGPYNGTIQINTADAAMAAGQYLQILQSIEGIRTADFQWGTAGALPIVLRFKAVCSIALTFAVSLKNGANNRSYVKNCTIAANTPTWFTIPIPGDTTGTWAIDTASSISLSFGLASGTTFHAPSEGWSAGAFIATATTSNFWVTAGARFSFGAVGLYLDANGTGVPPPWAMPDEAQEMMACQRYFGIYTMTILNASSGVSTSVMFPVDMRTTPAITGGGAGFANYNPTTRTAQFAQTTYASQTLYLSARM